MGVVPPFFLCSLFLVLNFCKLEIVVLLLVVSNRRPLDAELPIEALLLVAEVIEFLLLLELVCKTIGVRNKLV